MGEESGILRRQGDVCLLRDLQYVKQMWNQSWRKQSTQPSFLHSILHVIPNPNLLSFFEQNVSVSLYDH